MGGGYYERDDYGSSSSSGWGWDYSSGSSGSYGSGSRSSTLDKSMLPKEKVLESNTKQPVIIVLDVTGSNTEHAKTVYDKMPMFYGNLKQKGYLDDFDISFCAVGDAYCDTYPLQAGSFAKGTELDSWIKKIVLEGGGGGQVTESYELMAYYLYHNTRFQDGARPIVFFIGDEKPYEQVEKSQAEEYGLPEPEGNTNAFALLRNKVKDNIYMLLTPYHSYGSCVNDEIEAAWKKLMPKEHVIKITAQKSIMDVMLGIISMVYGKRTLDTYKIDMKNRGQTAERIGQVTDSLAGLSTSLVPVTVNGNVATTSARKSTTKGRRI